MKSLSASGKEMFMVLMRGENMQDGKIWQRRNRSLAQARRFGLITVFVDFCELRTPLRSCSLRA
jgi:hypothetical protein